MTVWVHEPGEFDPRSPGVGDQRPRTDGSRGEPTASVCKFWEEPAKRSAKPSTDYVLPTALKRGQASASVVSLLIHSRYFSKPPSTGIASSSGTLYGCSSANAARRESSRPERDLSSSTTSCSSAIFPCQR